MSGHYPAGVTGNEYQIAGPELGRVENVECLVERDVSRELTVECPFTGDVDVEYVHGVRYWTCPLCNWEHEDDLNER